MEHSKIPHDMLIPGVELTRDALHLRAAAVMKQHGHVNYYPPEEDEVLSRNHRMLKALRSLLATRGSRYIPASFANYKAELPEQKVVVRQLVDYGRKAYEHLQSGTNIVLFGPKGTGKDHLLIALTKLVAMEAGIVPTWINGVDLYSKLRSEAVDRQDGAFVDSIQKMKDAPILIISDPVPPAGVLSEFLQNTLFQIIDHRYSHRKPTWITLNVTNGEEASQRIGYQTVDRLRDGAVVLSCNWESYRKPCQKTAHADADGNDEIKSDASVVAYLTSQSCAGEHVHHR